MSGPPVSTQPRIPLRRVCPEPVDRLAPTWRQARPARIARSLDRALGRDPGGWYVVGASGDVRPGRTRTRHVAGREVVLWRGPDGTLRAGPGACPHLGALLDGCAVTGEDVVCRWHGMALGPGTGRAWPMLAAHDDGVLCWVRLPTPGEQPSQRPALPPRPDPRRAVTVVVALAATCEPRDIIANRLDPWHGAWFHPYAFSHLTVDEAASDEDRLVLDVTFHVTGRLGVGVTASFTCPDARTIVMTILAGEGEGSVVETHATPLGVDGHGRALTVMTEATVATSTRPGFGLALAARPVIRPLMRRAAARLWRDDLEYAERLWLLRTRAARA